MEGGCDSFVAMNPRPSQQHMIWSARVNDSNGSLSSLLLHLGQDWWSQECMWSYLRNRPPKWATSWFCLEIQLLPRECIVELCIVRILDQPARVSACHPGCWMSRTMAYYGGWERLAFRSRGRPYIVLVICDLYVASFQRGLSLLTGQAAKRWLVVMGRRCFVVKSIWS